MNSIFKQNPTYVRLSFILTLLVFLGSNPLEGFSQIDRHTKIEIRGNQFFINGKPTYEGVFWEGKKVEGLLMNSRMVQGIFDDSNPETIKNWEYPDTKIWDAERNTREFVENIPVWKSYGLLSFTLNLQGGSPFGYSSAQPWINTPFTPDGELKEDYFLRLEKILDQADRSGMVPILGLYYFGQDENLEDEKAVIKAVENTIDWILDKGYQNVLIEVNNECNGRYDHEILQPHRVHELIQLIQSKQKDGRKLLVSTSFGGGVIPRENVVRNSDFILLHGNGVDDPKAITSQIEQTKLVSGYGGQPIVYNEDDHFAFDQETNNFVAAVSAYASWGFFDYRMKDEGFEQGYQSVPVDWQINSERKKGFFNLLKEITGY